MHNNELITSIDKEIAYSYLAIALVRAGKIIRRSNGIGYLGNGVDLLSSEFGYFLVCSNKTTKEGSNNLFTTVLIPALGIVHVSEVLPTVIVDPVTLDSSGLHYRSLNFTIEPFKEDEPTCSVTIFGEKVDWDNSNYVELKDLAKETANLLGGILEGIDAQ